MNDEQNGMILETMEQHTSLHDEAPQGASFDYSFVDTVGRIALYDDLRSAPRVVEIKPADTAAYIEALASTVYEQSHGAGEPSLTPLFGRFPKISSTRASKR